MFLGKNLGWEEKWETCFDNLEGFLFFGFICWRKSLWSGTSKVYLF